MNRILKNFIIKFLNAIIFVAFACSDGKKPKSTETLNQSKVQRDTSNPDKTFSAKTEKKVEVKKYNVYKNIIPWKY